MASSPEGPDNNGHHELADVARDRAMPVGTQVNSLGGVGTWEQGCRAYVAGNDPLVGVTSALRGNSVDRLVVATSYDRIPKHDTHVSSQRLDQLMCAEVASRTCSTNPLSPASNSWTGP
jgi:hypothetical protein